MPKKVNRKYAKYRLDGRPGRYDKQYASPIVIEWRLKEKKVFEKQG